MILLGIGSSITTQSVPQVGANPPAGWSWYICVALLAGVINLANAWTQLAHECRYLRYFQPFKNFGIYLWSLVQLLFPAAVVWAVKDLTARPPIDRHLWVYSATTGAAFVLVLNAKTQVGNRQIDLRVIYEMLVGFAMKLIAQSETGRTAQFEIRLIKELRLVSSDNIVAGLNYLTRYVSRDVSLPLDVKSTLTASIDRVRKGRSQQIQAEEIPDILLVRRRDLPVALTHFGCSSELIASVAGRGAMEKLDQQIAEEVSST